MKQLMKKTAAKIVLAVFALFTLCNLALAQNNGGSSVTTTTHTETQQWYVQPWVWIVGGAVFVLILVALLRGGRSRDSLTVTKTTTESSDI